MKGYSTFPRAPEMDPHKQMQCLEESLTPLQGIESTYSQKCQQGIHCIQDVKKRPILLLIKYQWNEKDFSHDSFSKEISENLLLLLLRRRSKMEKKEEKGKKEEEEEEVKWKRRRKRRRKKTK